MEHTTRTHLDPGRREPEAESLSVTPSPLARHVRDRRRVTIGRFLVLAMVAFLLGTCAVRLGSFIVPSPVAQGRAPDVILTTFDGNTIALADLRGQAVVVNFWASWCGPCRAETPLLAQAARRNPDVQFLGVAVQDGEAAARAFALESGMEYPLGFDGTGEWDRAFAVRGLPQTFFIAPDGTIAEQVQGAFLSAADLEKRLAKIREGMTGE